MGSLDKCSFQLIDENGTFNVDGLDNFIEKVKLAESGVSYAVISIMGPQSSGKSTLLNHLFGTNFKEMDAYDGRSQTTKGIWLANCANTETRTLVMDVEGTDGQERGQDDTNFERQSALFALAVSDIVLLNMWCHDIGREQAANKPLLRNVFQVMLTLFHPRKVTLMFVIRDKSKTPWEKLEKDLRKDIQMIWNSVPKSQAYKQTPLSEIFNVEVVGLSNYERDEHLFKNEVADLKQNIFHSILPGWLAEDRQGVVHASAFSLSTGRIWDIIKENKHLDLPKHSVMVATIRCKEILNEKFVGFSENEEWCELKEKVRTQAISGFGDKLNSLLNTCLSEYNAEAAFYDEGVRNAKWEKLKAKLLQLVQPACQSMLEHIRSTALDGFKDALIMALEKGTDLSVAVTLCTESSMSLFDEQYADATIELAEMDNSHGRDMLQGGINDVVDPVVPIFEHAQMYANITSVLVTGSFAFAQMTTSGFSAGLFLGGMSFGALAGRQCAKYIKKYATKKATKAIERGSN